MENKDLDKKFREAVEIVNNYTDPLPADTLLRLYAYYKIATKNHSSPNSKQPLINAFKINALFQAQNVTEEEAKKHYISLVNTHLIPPSN